ncbi:choice-of-anchor G family protein [Promicromonospora aerolata]|uniref:Choice-of-anchor G family protein n=1 Tax=Promicromonospora aerolata TaxID=195749 RepID=A0ABW4V2D0_9MICO
MISTHVPFIRRREFRRRERGGATWRRGLAAVAASALLVTAAGLPAAAVDNYPDEPAEAAASVLAAELMQEELLGAATSDAGSVSNPGPNTENLDVDVLGAQALQLGDLQLPVDQFLDFGQIGALASTSEASGPADAHAVSGLLGADGGVTLDGAEDSFGTATIDVLSLARLAGVDGITDQVVDQLTIELGALGAEVIAEAGVVLDPDGGATGPGQYRLGDGTLLLHSPVIEDAAATVFDIGGTVDTQIETMVNDTFDVTDLTALLSAVPGIPEPTVTVDSNLQETLFQSVVGEPITSANQLVTIDLSTGELQVHLEHLVEGNDPWGGGDDAGMNGLAPNYEVLDDQTYPQIAEGVHEVMQEATRIMVGAIEDSLNAVTIDIAFYDESPLGTLDVSWSVPLADAVNGDFPEVVNDSTGTQAVTGTLLATTINGLGNAAAPIFGAVYDAVISDAGDELFEVLINDLKTGITSTIGAALSPVFDVVVQFVSLQINHQETATCTTAGGVDLFGQVEVSALSLGLVQSADAGRIGLGNAGVRIDACDLSAIAPELTVDPSAVYPGDDVTLTGSGYTPNSTVSLVIASDMGNGYTASAIPTDENGGFVYVATLGEGVAPTDYVATATDDATDAFAEAPLVVLAPEPTLTVDPGEAQASDEVTVTGSSYTPGSTVDLEIVSDLGVLFTAGDIPVDEFGGFEYVVPLPDDSYPTDYVVTGTDAEGLTADADLVVLPLEPTLTVDPDEAQAGDEVTVTGAGYTPNSTVDLEIVSDLGVLYTAGDIPTDENGGFEHVVALPDDSAPTDYVVTGTDFSTDVFAEAPLVVVDLSDVVPTLTVDPGEAQASDEVTVTGTGYTPDSTVDLEIVSDLGVLYTAGDIPTDENGGFEYVVVLPDDSYPTDYVVTGTDAEGLTADADLVVLPLEPTLTVDPDEAFPGDEVTVTGAGYTPDSTVDLEIVSDLGVLFTAGDIPTDGDGGFEYVVPLPDDSAPTDYVVTGTDFSTDVFATDDLVVLDPAADGPMIVVDPAEAQASEEVTITGSGYTPDSTVDLEIVSELGVLFTAGDIPTDEDGAFEYVVPLPADSYPTDYVVTGTDAEDLVADADLVVLPLEPTLTVDPGAAQAGEEVTVTGAGYTPDSTVDLEIVSDLGVLYTAGDIPTDGDGGFEHVVALPDDSAPTDYVVTGTDFSTDVFAEAPLVVITGVGQCASAPELTVTPAAVQAGESVLVVGTGFPAGVDVEVQLVDVDGNPLGDPVTVTVDESCGFWTDYVVPEGTAPGEHEIGAEPEDGSEGATAPLTVEPADITPELTVDPSEVAPGGTVTVAGEGYTPDSTVTVQLTDADENPVGDPVTVDTDETGAFTTELVVPEDAEPGDHTVVGTDDTTGTPAEAPLVVGVGSGPGDECTDPTLVADPTTVEPGAEVTVTGTGFPAGVEVTVTLTDAAGEPVGESVTVVPDDSCGFTVTIVIPDDAEPGAHVIVAEPEDGSDGAEVPIMVAGPDSRVLTAWFEDDEVAQGASQTFSASGFEPGEMVVGVIRSTSVRLPAAAADGTGTVQWTFTVPAGLDVGSHVGIATSQMIGDSATASFEVVLASTGGGTGDGDGDDDRDGAGNGTGDGSGSNGNGTGSGSGSSSGSLAATGADVATLLAVTVLLLAAGAALIRRRRELGLTLATPAGGAADQR